MLTGQFDKTSVARNSELKELRDTLKASTVSIEACHILNRSTMMGIDPAGTSEGRVVLNKVCPTTVSLVLHCPHHSHPSSRQIGLPVLLLFSPILDLKPSSTNSLKMVSMDLGIYSHYHMMCIVISTPWSCGLRVLERYVICGLSSTTNLTHRQPNHYKVCVSDPCYLTPLYKHEHLHGEGDQLFVTFPQNKDLQPPEPKLLALHAVCARVAHMSGAAEAFDKLECDVEDIRVLNFDGSSAPLLNHLLAPFTIIPAVA